MFNLFKKKIEPNLDRSREEIVERILQNNEAYYNVTRVEEKLEVPLVARCDFFESVEKYLISKKAELYTTQSEEFLYIFSINHLDMELYTKCKEYALEDAMPRMNIGPDHMCSVVGYHFIVDTYDEDVEKAIKKCKIYKSFRFSLHGWMSGRMALIGVKDKVFISNPEGHSMAKALAQILIN